MLISSPLFAASPVEVVDYEIRKSTMSIPLDGVSRSGSSFRLDYGPGSTAAQRRTAAAIAQNTDVTAPALAAFDIARKRDAANAIFSQDDQTSRLLKALVIWQAQKLGITPAQARAEIKAILDAN